MVHQLGLALFQIGQRLIAQFFRLVQGLRQPIHFRHVAACDAGEPVQKPMGKPAHGKGCQKDDCRRDDEFCAVHSLSSAPSLAALSPSGRGKGRIVFSVGATEGLVSPEKSGGVPAAGVSTAVAGPSAVGVTVV